MAKHARKQSLSFSPTERRFLAVLADGKPHTLKELKAYLYDELGTDVNVRMHISKLRRKLSARGISIAQLHGAYLLVQPIPLPSGIITRRSKR